jgi:hypothetical protein
MKNPNIKVLKVCVTKADIAKGRQESTSSCPIAHALRRASKGKCIKVDNTDAYFSDTRKGHRRQWFATDKDFPRGAVTFIQNFDNAGKKAVKPKCFRLVFRTDPD